MLSPKKGILWADSSFPRKNILFNSPLTGFEYLVTDRPDVLDRLIDVGVSKSFPNMYSPIRQSVGQQTSSLFT